MFRQSEGRQRPLVDGAVIGDDELSLRQRMGPGVPATAASTRTARVNVSSRAENTYAVSPTTLLARCGCRLAIRCCASCRCPRSHHGVEGWRVPSLPVFSRHQPRQPHPMRARLVSSHHRSAHLRSTRTISPLHKFAHSHNLPQPIRQLMHAIEWLLMAVEAHVQVCVSLRNCTVRRCHGSDRRLQLTTRPATPHLGLC